MIHSLTLFRRVPAVCAVLAAALLATACGGGKSATEAGSSQVVSAAETEHAEGPELKLSPQEAERAGLQVRTLEPQPLRSVVTVTATIKPNQDRFARVAPRVEGRLLEVSGRLGETVRAGQVLATLDSVALGEAQSALRQAQAAQRVTQADFDRAQGLAADEIIPQKDLLRARSELDKANAELRATRDKLRLLGANGGEADFTLRAPIAGTVIERKGAAGELVTPSEAVFTVADLSKVWIEANLSEDLLGRVQVGAPASVSVDAYPGTRFAGRVTYIASVLDSNTRTVPARIEVDNADTRLKLEMFATAAIDTGAVQGQVLSVPDAAVVLMQGQPTVYVQVDGGYYARAVETGDKQGGRTVIKSGVQAGERVVMAGTYALKARQLKSQISDSH
ncbi:efflux RND transporter periplasmic adaptor subunit [Comamonas flocculans]|uniref:Efflux RND transporter periplasmic adaptor subunit n=1 Tax=Comamonas flocculans TaxID=2597701 RepID=A0A5B8RRM3_9BURK|nr:efflux RND transporter periplasmic adaptor subunit [Comamonas flocculans]QEA12279.1 efflux RND transporter periplasmic adaptor subunit [Comamonas flocculans]